MDCKPLDAVLVAPRREHSRKPDLAYRYLEAMYGDVRRVDLFSRERRSGWTAWGLEVDRFPPTTAPSPP
jgi:N6-adenosine-specific RNA methylase IME4